MKKPFECWRCGAPLREDQLPINRLEQCHYCHAELHVCRMCRSWNPRYTSKCSHDHAEPPLERERANFCQYFKPAFGAHRSAGMPVDTARADLDALFGAAQVQPGAAETEDASETERARKALDELFGGSKDDETREP